MSAPQDNTKPPQPLLDDTEVRKSYRETTIFIRDTYFPHYNLYQKTMLQEKLKCYTDHEREPDKYFRCLDKIDEVMHKNSNKLQQQFGFVEIKDKECQDACKATFREDQSRYLTCALKCTKNMKDGCITVYNQFYEGAVGKNPEFKKLKKISPGS